MDRPGTIAVRPFKRSLYIIILTTLPFIFEKASGVSFVHLGVYPRSLRGLPGVLTGTFVHGDVGHLLGNLLLFTPLLIGLFTYFEKRSFKLLLIFSITTNLLVWLFARNSWHIGASGVVYATFFFLTVVGIKLRRKELLLFPIIVLFLSVGFWVGLIPVQAKVSYESHIFGSIVGSFLGLFQNNPKNNIENTQSSINSTISGEYNYIFKENPDD